jgi:thiol-disulfide isomerase/thioredoxin
MTSKLINKTSYDLTDNILHVYTANNFTCRPCLRINPFIQKQFKNLNSKIEIIPIEDGPGKVPHFVITDVNNKKIISLQTSNPDSVFEFLLYNNIFDTPTQLIFDDDDF